MPVSGAPTLGSESWDFPVNKDGGIFAGIDLSGSIFTGNQNYAGFNYFVSFRFYADNFVTVSNTLALFFYNETSDRTWRYKLDGPSVIDAWSYYNLPVSWSTNWSSPGFGRAEFNTDIADVDQLGIWVFRELKRR
ncbi:MAG: hypothetical protein PHR77_03730 [Kiritimatiellae bacterium]|nr:hypothetical protein [Kiritimatiellia bacterium]MDD5521943.1 hypothetical protein [Kiritimatiellia bacterium]